MFVNRLTLLSSCALACVTLVALPRAARAEAGLQPLDSIRAKAESSLRGVIDPGVSGLTLQATALDPRLRFASCAQKLDGFAQTPRGNQSRATVRVSCDAPAWTLNVPVEIRRSHSVLVLRRAVGRGEALSAADVNTQTRVLPGLGSPFVSATDQLAGRTTRRTLPEGTALTADSLTAVLLIHRGQTVTLLANSAGFEVRAPGRAMADATVNQRVRVQNLHSLKIVEGLADKEGVVRVLP
jgi:flagella basal body P-ring formation protein FlgA